MSVIYELKCDCGHEFEPYVRMDAHYDVYVEVPPCPVCLEEAKQEGIKKEEKKLRVTYDLEGSCFLATN